MVKIMLYFAKIKSFLCDMYKKNKKLFFLSVGLCLIVLFSAVVYFSKGKSFKIKEEKSSQNISLDAYAASVENKIESILFDMKSVSKVKVFVMLESSSVVEYLTEKEVVEIGGSGGTTTTTTTKVVYQKDGSKSSPVQVSVLPPKISGVLIFLNKIDASTKLSITNSVACVLNINASCISILQDS
jgi:stage III sporulation protein AG